MNLQSRTNQIADGVPSAATVVGFFRQILPHGLFFPRLMIQLLDCSRSAAIGLLLALVQASFFSAQAQTNYYYTNGTEYAAIGSLPGDQVFPDVAISTTSGFMVWQDNATDGSGWGISARRLDATLSGTLGAFRVNAIGEGSQENPRVALLKNGGAAFVWQGGRLGYQHIYARLLTSTNTFITNNDILVNSFTNNFQINPSIALLSNSNLVVVWASYNQFQTNSFQDIYGQILSPSGNKIGTNFLINQFVNFNQRTPAVAALPGGGFVVTWVSEQQQQLSASLGTNSTYVKSPSTLIPSIDIYARVFDASGVATASEFRVNTDKSPAANPAVSVATDGSFLVAWTSRNLTNFNESLDVYGRTFVGAGNGGSVFRINSFTYGDQFAPRLSAIGLDYFVTWTSLAQDGAREGVYGQYVHNNGALIGNEFRVNTTTVSQQMQPSVASDGVGQFLVVWTSFTGVPNTFDLYAQRYLNVSSVLQPMSAPYVWAPFVVSNNVYQPRLVISWAPLLGLSVSNYSVYLDGATTPISVVASNQWTMTSANGLTVNSSHSFQVDYTTTDGRRSPISPSASGTTWQGYNWGGIPFEWMTAYYGSDISQWPSSGSKLGGNGPTVAQVFLSGGNPLNSSTWLKQNLTTTSQGIFLTWNTQPGAMYQVQVTTNLNVWSNFGSPRFAAGVTDSIYVGGNTVAYYRVWLLR